MRKRFTAPDSRSDGRFLSLVKIGVWVLLGGFLVWAGMFVWGLQSKRTWNPAERLTVVWAAADDAEYPVAVMSYEKDQPLVVLQLPPEVRVGVAYGYGDYEIRSLRGLAEQEDRYELLADTLMDVMGTPIHEWVVSSHPDCDYTQEACVKKLLWLWGRDTAVQTNLPVWDRFALWWHVRDLRKDKIQVINAAEGSWARKIETIDKKQMVVFDSAFIDARVAPLLTDTSVRKENVSVAVVNTVGEPGLARQVSRIVSGMGAWVVRTENATDMVERCLLKTHLTAEESLTVRRLVKAFGCDVVIQPQNERYGIELWVGRDQQRWWVGGN